MKNRRCSSCRERIEAIDDPDARIDRVQSLEVDRTIDVVVLDAFDRVVGPTEGECPCKLTAQVMREIGATNAAASHDPNNAGSAKLATTTQVEAHMRDEETILHPVLRRMADRFEMLDQKPRADRIRRYVARIEAEHAEIRRVYTSSAMMPPASVLGPHGQAEDRFVAEYADLIRSEAARMKAERAQRGAA